MKRKAIVLAFVEMRSEPVPGQTWRHDLGERPKMREVPVAKAAMWLNDGDDSDVEKAIRYAKMETSSDRVASVHLFPVDAYDPLGRAKREALKEFKKRARAS